MCGSAPPYASSRLTWEICTHIQISWSNFPRRCACPLRGLRLAISACRRCSFAAVRTGPPARCTCTRLTSCAASTSWPPSRCPPSESIWRIDPPGRWMPRRRRSPPSDWLPRSGRRRFPPARTAADGPVSDACGPTSVPCADARRTQPSGRPDALRCAGNLPPLLAPPRPVTVIPGSPPMPLYRSDPRLSPSLRACQSRPATRDGGTWRLLATLLDWMRSRRDRDSSVPERHS
jgi:hypothetical protein